MREDDEPLVWCEHCGGEHYSDECDELTPEARAWLADEEAP